MTERSCTSGPLAVREWRHRGQHSGSARDRGQVTDRRNIVLAVESGHRHRKISAEAELHELRTRTLARRGLGGR
jgi:hypothetical protein